MDRWTRGSIVVVLPLNRWHGYNYILMFDRLTDGPLMMLHGCSFIRETDGPLGISNGRLTDWTYCTVQNFVNFVQFSPLLTPFKSLTIMNND
ncbi:hypothetical protein DEO72_LG1g3176 [Vigna unguiculata]|uniref:Uncharacterized protein n=1 Tax=Vigna unguiculata TaxID=3917 RepID=A0A4D6KZG3_VIGUN|nr:hypothetical protein DEO72_LG1g3176 [Vigna unguiculata]